MNKIFLSYQNSSRCFLSDIKDITVVSGHDYLQQASSVKLYDYSFLETSVVTQLNSEQGNFIFFENPTYEVGFLGKIDAINDSINREIHPLHLELHSLFGSIIDSYSINNNKELLPYSEVFSVDEDIFGLADLESDYLEKCEKNNVKVIPDLLTLTTLAVESNGNLIQYDESGEIHLYLADHSTCNADFTQMNTTPPDTFYTSNKIVSIKEWIDSYFYQYLSIEH